MQYITHTRSRDRIHFSNLCGVMLWLMGISSQPRDAVSNVTTRDIGESGKVTVLTVA